MSPDSKPKEIEIPEWVKLINRVLKEKKGDKNENSDAGT